MLSPKRLELLQAVHKSPAPSINALAIRLRRDDKRVYENVETLTASGLLKRDDGTLSAPYDAITAEMRPDSILRTTQHMPWLLLH